MSSLEGVEVGDLLVYQPRFTSKNHLTEVTRVNKQFVETGAGNFSIKDGCERPRADWRSIYARIPTPEDIESIHLRQRLEVVKSKLQDFKVTPANVGLVEEFLEKVGEV